MKVTLALNFGDEWGPEILVMDIKTIPKIGESVNILD